MSDHAVEMKAIDDEIAAIRATSDQLHAASDDLKVKYSTITSDWEQVIAEMFALHERRKTLIDRMIDLRAERGA